MEKVVRDLDIDDVMPNRFQPRLKFDENSLNELADSIKEHGVLQPIVVRQIGEKYEIIAGERRYKASVIAGKTTIPAIVVDMTDKISAEMALIENLQRENLTPLEEAISYKKTLDMGYMTQTELAKKMGRSQPFVANKLRLLDLTDEVQDALLNNEISERHARSLLRLYDDYEQNKMLEKIINERLTVRQLDQEIAKVIEDDKSFEVLDFLSDWKDDNMNNEVPVTPNVAPTEVQNVPLTELQSTVVPAQTETPAVTPAEISVVPMPQPAIPTVDPFTATEEVKPVEVDINKIINEAPKEEPTTPTPEVKPFEDVKVDGINPGFADVDKIETEASEIYKPKPVADLDKILAPADFKIEHDPEPTPEPETPITSGKFFNFGIEEAEAPTKVETELPSIEPPVYKPEPTPEPEIVPTPANMVKSLDDLDTDSEPKTPFDTTGYNNFDYQPDQELEIKLPETDVPAQVQTASLVDVINIIREASEKIEGLGFEIDLEEFDFDDMYQAIFKVSKK